MAREHGIKDEPQHVKQGRIMLDQLRLLDIDYAIMPDDIALASEMVAKACKSIQLNQKPFALVVQKKCFDSYKLQNTLINQTTMQREDAIKIILDTIDNRDILVSTTGKTSREVFEYREAQNIGHARDFLTVGSMGHASQIALGIALQKRNRRVICIDGDGAALMHIGSMPVGAATECTNFKHIIINNEAHDSVGGQSTVGRHLDFHQLAIPLGYGKSFQAQDASSLHSVLPAFLKCTSTALLEIKARTGARANLGRPTTTPIENKTQFMEFCSMAKSIINHGATAHLTDELLTIGAKHILLVTGKSSYQLCGAEANITSQLEALECIVTHFNDFTPNPKLEELAPAIEQVKTHTYDCIVAIGGGSSDRHCQNSQFFWT